MKPSMSVVKRIARPIARLSRDRRGATAIEYGLILALVFLAMLVGLYALGTSTSEMWGYVDRKVSTAR